MYKLIGADQQEYGPVTAEQLRQWIREGRLNARSMVQAIGLPDWRPLSGYPEFAADLEQGPKLRPPPVRTRGDPLAIQARALKPPLSVDGLDCLDRAWKFLIADWWPLFGVSALVWLLILIANGAYLGLAVNGPLLGGWFYYLLKKIRHEPVALEDSFAGFTLAFVPLLLVSLVSGILEAVGLVLCILPGLYLMLAWIFAVPLVIDKQLDFWDAMEVSRKVVNQHFLPLLGLFLLSWLINLVGGIILCVGTFFTMPLTMLAWVYAYEVLFAPSTTVLTTESP